MKIFKKIVVLIYCLLTSCLCIGWIVAAWTMFLQTPYTGFSGILFAVVSVLMLVSIGILSTTFYKTVVSLNGTV